MRQVERTLAAMAARAATPAIHWKGLETSYQELSELTRSWSKRLDSLNVRAGTVCGLLGDYSPQYCAALLALMAAGAVVAPLGQLRRSQVAEYAELASMRVLIEVRGGFDPDIEPLASPTPAVPLLDTFRERRHAGLIVFTSGSSGRPKGILHDCEAVLAKFESPRPAYRTLLFLLPDHFGGFNTLMSVFSYGGTAVVPDARTPEAVCRAIEDARAELLPVTPTFLNLLRASGTYVDFDLSSVKLVTYGTEVMPESTLQKVLGIFPNARFQQTYGLSELGVLRSRSRDSGSVWVKLGGEGFETRVVNGTLHVRSRSAMVGYLNAENPIDADGWMDTGDTVEVQGEYVRVLGRRSDVINVGGQKVFPQEVEELLLRAPHVTEAVVYAESHPLLGKVVAARISLDRPEPLLALKTRLRKFCLERLPSYKVPVRISIEGAESLMGERGKKIRP